MKRLIRNVLLFLLPILVILAIIPVNKRLVYQGLKEDCANHGIWIHDRMHINVTPIDLAFLGSSKTMNAVNDKLLSDSISNIQIANLGYCRLGRNFSFALFKELLTVKKPQHLVIEVREKEDRYSHPIFPHLAESEDVMFPNLLFNRDVLDDMWTHFAYKIEILQDEIYQREPIFPIDSNDFGFESFNGDFDFEYYDKIKQKKPKPTLSDFENDFYNTFPRKYFKKINDLCVEKNIRLSFLYLPSYTSTSVLPTEYETYSQYGTVLLPPSSIFTNHSNWFDNKHLNKKGANELSLWLLEQLQTEYSVSNSNLTFD